MGNLVSINLLAATATASFVLGAIYQRKQFETLIEMDDCDMILRPKLRVTKTKFNTDDEPDLTLAKHAQNVGTAIVNNGLNWLINLTSGQCFETRMYLTEEFFPTNNADYVTNEAGAVYAAGADIIESKHNNNMEIAPRYSNYSTERAIFSRKSKIRK